jgi:hypothetical protein
VAAASPRDSSLRRRTSIPDGLGRDCAALRRQSRLKASKASKVRRDDEPPILVSVPQMFGLFTDIKITDALLALFTFFLMIYTARLFYATRNLVGAEAPILVPQNFRLNGIRDFDSPKEEVDFWFDFRNVGRTSAYLTELHFGVQHHAGELPPNAATTESKDIFVIVAPDKFLSPAKNAGDIQIPIALRRAIIEKTTNLYIYGKMNFEEISGVAHTQGFAVKFVPGDTPAEDMIVNCGPRSYWQRT